MATELENKPIDPDLHSLRVEYEAGKDGCMPSGWYLCGLGRHGFRLQGPESHEYGPFSSIEEAITDIDPAYAHIRILLQPKSSL